MQHFTGHLKIYETLVNVLHTNTRGTFNFLYKKQCKISKRYDILDPECKHSLRYHHKLLGCVVSQSGFCKTETLGSLYSHALLIPLKSKYQVVHLKKFKDLLSSTCQVSGERIVLDLEWEARVLFPLGVTFCHWIFFHIVKPLMPILTLLPIRLICEKLVCNDIFSFVLYWSLHL